MRAGSSIQLPHACARRLDGGFCWLVHYNESVPTLRILGGILIAATLQAAPAIFPLKDVRAGSMASDAPFFRVQGRGIRRGNSGVLENIAPNSRLFSGA